MASSQTPDAEPAKPLNELTASAIPLEARDAEKVPYSGGQMVLTVEERALIKECERESIYKRALPLSAGAMFATSMMVRSGRWQGHPKYGALPKMFFFGGIGYIAGKIQYLPHCQEKILQTLPNSNLAASVRKSRGMPDADDTGDTSTESDFPKIDDRKLREEYNASDSAPPPSARPPTSGLDDRFRPSVDKDVKPREENTEESKQPRVSYEELRRRNRQQYEENQAKKPSSPPPKNNPFLPQKVWPDSSEGGDQQAPPPSREPQKKKRTNIWGDTIED